MGFLRKIGNTSSFMAKLWALRDGLLICVNHNYSAVEVEADAKVVIDVLANPRQSNNFILSILDYCRQLASQIPQICFSHCNREANKCADFMARKGTHQNEDFCLFENPPVGLNDLLAFDRSGMYLNRRCLVNIFSLSYFLCYYLFYPKKKKKWCMFRIRVRDFCSFNSFFFNLNMVYQHIMQASPQAKQS